MKRFTRDIPDTLEGQGYNEFGALNQVIEQNNISSEDALQAYHDTLLDVLGDSEKTTIHWQMKYLIEEAKVAVNKIHSFISFKFPGVEGIIENLIEASPVLPSEVSEVINQLVSSKNPTLLVAGIMGKDREILTDVKLQFSVTDNNEQKIFKVKQFIADVEKYYNNGDVKGLTIMSGETRK